MKKFLLVALLTVNFSLYAMEDDYYDSDNYGSSDTDTLIQIGDILSLPGGILDYALANKTLLDYPENNRDITKIKQLIQTREDKKVFIRQIENNFLSFPEISAAQEDNLRFELCRELEKKLGADYE